MRSLRKIVGAVIFPILKIILKLKEVNKVVEVEQLHKRFEKVNSLMLWVLVTAISTALMVTLPAQAVANQPAKTSLNVNAYNASAPILPSIACNLTPSRFSSALAALGSRGFPSWVASDGFVSDRLPDGRTMFVNSDTFWGTSDGGYRMTSGTMINNTLMIYDPNNPQCFEAISGAGGKSLIPPTNPSHWVWPSKPTIEGDKVVIPNSQMRTKPGVTGMWSFELAASEVRNYIWNGQTIIQEGAPRALSPTTAEPPGDLFEWVGSMVDGDWVYLLPTNKKPTQWGHDLFLARIPKNIWFATNGTPIISNIEFRTGTGWKKNATYAELYPVVQGAGDAAASMTKGLGEYHIILKEHSIIGTNIVDYHAPTLDGEFTKHILKVAPLKANSFSYWANVHPSLGSVGLSRKITINFNNAKDEGWNNLLFMNRYRPELIDVVLPEVVKISTGKPNSVVAANLTTTNSNSSGFITAYPCDATPPTASNVNFLPGFNRANGVFVKTDAEGNFCITMSTGVHVVADFSGTVTQTSVTSPVRLLDTREPNPQTNRSKAPAGSVLRIATGAPGGSTVLGNLTVTNPEGGGFTTLFPCDTPQPNASTNNYTPNQTIANYAAVKSDSNGEICVYTTTTTHLIYDYSGFSYELTPQDPVRKLDTRLPDDVTSGSPAKAGTVTRIQTSSVGGTVTGNLTVATPTDRGFLTAYPCDNPRGNTSSLNYAAKETVPNFVTSRVDPSGGLCVYTTTDTHIIFDETSTSTTIQSVEPQRLRDTRLG